RQARGPAKPKFRNGRVRGALYDGHQRKEAVETFLKSELEATEFCRIWGIADARTLRRWVDRYELKGPDSLEGSFFDPRKSRKKRAR
ncbi:helix-turn-helix domain-containing protein, partial [Staphylococcus aureus]|uniref:helix-turn-helix domain-containing protein n=1 Tax=Staphylococcus aureus TaxID=1280 RepID=UPI0034D2A74C